MDVVVVACEIIVVNSKLLLISGSGNSALLVPLHCEIRITSLNLTMLVIMQSTQPGIILRVASMPQAQAVLVIAWLVANRERLNEH